MNDFKVNDVVICVTDIHEPFFTKGKEYVVKGRDGSRIDMFSECGSFLTMTDQYYKKIVGRLNNTEIKVKMF